MTNITHDGSTETLPGAAHKNSVWRSEMFIDFAIMAGDVTIGTTDVVQALELPKGTVILAAGIEVLKVESTNTTAKVSLGDGADVARYVDALVLTSLGQLTPAATMGDGFALVADDTVDVVISVDDPTDAKIKVWVDCVGSYHTGPMTATTQIDAKTYS